MQFMILNRQNSAKSWSPDGFQRFSEFYPATAWTVPPRSLDQTDRFLDHWAHRQDTTLPKNLHIVLTPGLFAEWLPQCFAAAKRAFVTQGCHVQKSKVSTALSTEEQAPLLAGRILEWLPPETRFLWCTHSKGGLDALWALEHDAELRERCAAAVLMQPPIGHSHLIEHWRNKPSSLQERALGRFLKSRWLAGGCNDISLQRNAKLQTLLDASNRTVPVLHVVSWSRRATSWVDSYHKQLNALRPGHAHDGQFYLHDQLLQETPVVCLPDLDHAQPVLGGLGLDVGRLWHALALTALE